MGEDSAKALAPSGTSAGDISEAFSSNAVRLSAAEWVVAVGLVVATALLLPWLVQRREAFQPSADYRHPYAYSEDYWLYARYSRYASSRYPVAVIGDSVVWGHYVEPAGTLPHFLNQEAGRPLFANLGLDGTRPMALAGLVRYYCTDLAGQGVILHLNPLWMSSDDADLHQRESPAEGRPLTAARVRELLRGRPESDQEGLRINHPGLVPQLFSRPYGYHPSLGEIIGIEFERQVPYAAWLRHIRMAYFENLGLPAWTMGNPYRNPLSAVTFRLPKPDDRPEGEPVPWFRSGVERQDFPWVPLDRSYQWARFRETLEVLRARHNTVFVVLGPMNIHLMTDGSSRRYAQTKAGMEAWLKAQGVPYCAPPPLPSGLYADASHPLKAGYAMLANQLFRDTGFREWVGGVGARHGDRRARAGGDR